MKASYKHIVICIFLFNAPIFLGNENNFDQAIQNLRNTKPELFEEKIEPKTTSSKDATVDHSFYEKLDKIVDIVALASALIRIYHRYYTLNTQADESFTLNKILDSIVPSFIPSLHTKIILIKETSIITLETIAYKTVAKMLLYCAKGDAYDLGIKILGKIKTLTIG